MRAEAFDQTAARSSAVAASSLHVMTAPRRRKRSLNARVPGEPVGGEERVVPGVRPRPKDPSGGGDVEPRRRIGVHRDHEDVGHARRQLAELGHDRGGGARGVGQAAEAGDLDVEGPRPAVGDREVRSRLAGSVRLERELDALVGQQQVGGPQLGPDVAQRLVVPSAAELLADLGLVRLGERAEPRRRREPVEQLCREPTVSIGRKQVCGEALDRWRGCHRSSHPATLPPVSSVVGDARRGRYPRVHPLEPS